MSKMLEKEADIHSALEEFYEALNALFIGDAAPMSDVWSHSNDVSYLGPQGNILVGWNHVFKAWKEQAQLKLKGKIKPEDIHIMKGDDLCVVQNNEVGTNIVNGKIEHIKIRATKTFRMENGKWKLISHHADPIGFLKDKSTK